jgi:hypothetical protein
MQFVRKLVNKQHIQAYSDRPGKTYVVVSQHFYYVYTNMYYTRGPRMCRPGPACVHVLMILIVEGAFCADC